MGNVQTTMSLLMVQRAFAAKGILCYHYQLQMPLVLVIVNTQLLLVA